MEHGGARAGAGAVGSAGSLGLRVGQAVFSSASLLFMSVGVEFFSYTAFWYLSSACLLFLISLWFKYTSVQRFLRIHHGYHQVLLIQFEVTVKLSVTIDSFLVTIMGLVIPWSCTLAMIDVYSVFTGCPLRVPGVTVIVVVGDCVLSILSFAAACSSAAVIDLLLQFHGSHCSPRFCGRYQLSAMMAFLSWFLTAVSALFNFWFLASHR